jgi:hypothetical protein
MPRIAHPAEWPTKVDVLVAADILHSAADIVERELPHPGKGMIYSRNSTAPLDTERLSKPALHCMRQQWPLLPNRLSDMLG